MKKIFAILIMLTVCVSSFSQTGIKPKSKITASLAEFIGKNWNNPEGVWLKFIDGDFFYVLSYDDCPDDVDSVGFYVYKYKIYGDDIFYLDKLLIGYVSNLEPYVDYNPHSIREIYRDVYYPDRINGNQTMSRLEIMDGGNVRIYLRYGNRLDGGDAMGIPYKHVVIVDLTKDDSNFGYNLTTRFIQ